MRRCPALARPATRLAGLFSVGLLLSGCHYASSPFDGFGGFIGDTHTFSNDPTHPHENSENMQRASGQDAGFEPLLPESGNVWPGPPPPEPSLADVQKQQNQENQQIDRANPPPSTTPVAPHRQPRGSSTPPGSVQTAPSPLPNPEPFDGSSIGVAPPRQSITPPVINTPGGTLIPNNSGNGVTTATRPGGGTSIVVPNGNGTSTIIGPDGTTSIMPTPR